MAIFFAKSRNFLILVRLWHFHKEANKTKYVYFLKSWAIILCGCFLGALSLLDFIEAIQTDQVDVIFTKLLFLCVALVIIHKVFTVTYFEENIIYCINQLENLSETFQNKTDIDHSHKQYETIFTFGRLILNVSVLFFMLVPLFYLPKKQLFFQPKALMVNLEESPIWELMFIYQMFSALVVTNITLAYDTIYCGMLCISIGALRSVCREIREIDEVISDHQTSEAKFKNIIEKIIEISNFTDKISDMFSMTTMSHIIYICGTLALALFVVSTMPLQSLTCVSMILASVISIFLLWMYCFFGQILVDQRQILQNELYFIKWYNASKNLKTFVLVSISVLQRDKYVYAGRLIPLSMETFGQVLRKAYFYFAFMIEIFKS